MNTTRSIMGRLLNVVQVGLSNFLYMIGALALLVWVAAAFIITIVIMLAGAIAVLPMIFGYMIEHYGKSPVKPSIYILPEAANEQ